MSAWKPGVVVSGLVMLVDEPKNQQWVCDVTVRRGDGRIEDFVGAGAVSWRASAQHFEIHKKDGARAIVRLASNDIIEQTWRRA